MAKAMKQVGEGDLALIDPPYHAVSKRGGLQGSYYETPFEGTEELADFLRKFPEGAKAIVWNMPEGAKKFPFLDWVKTGFQGGKEVAAEINAPELLEIVLK